MTAEKKFDTREKIAALVSAVITVAAVVYWIIQIAGVIEMSKLASGG